jgi:pyridoxamine 5'-phosphate oxidase
MSKKIEKLRESYSKSTIDISKVYNNPVEQFNRWFQEAIKANLYEPSAMTLATVDSQGMPSARMVLLKGINERGFIFYTNYLSRKASQIAHNPQASLVFWWPELNRQVRVEGQVKKISKKSSDEYFKSRPRGSQIAAQISRQSEVLKKSDELQINWKIVSQQSRGRDVKRPKNWGGYSLKPGMIEFWQGQPNRLHTRIRYRRQKNQDWVKELLYP